MLRIGQRDAAAIESDGFSSSALGESFRSLVKASTRN
jgi:hypothetical protein